MAVVSNSSQFTGAGPEYESELPVSSTINVSPAKIRTGAPMFSDVIENLRGQTIKFDTNYLLSIFRSWPKGQNEHLQKLREDIYLGLASTIKNERDIRMIQEADLVSFAARSWPHASNGKLQFLVHLVIWAGVIEDHIEKLASDMQASTAFLPRAKAAWKSMLKLDNADVEIEPGAKINSLIQGFRPFAAKICSVYDHEQREALYGELVKYLDAVYQEALLKQEGRLPSYDQYLGLRYGSIGFGFFLNLSEFALGKKLPDDIRNASQWKDMHKAAVHITFLQVARIIISWTPLNVSRINDLCSAKRELENGEVLNSTLIRGYEFGRMEFSVAQGIHDIEISVAEFDMLAFQLINSSTVLDNIEEEAIAVVIDAMREFVVGGLEWSLASKRYMIKEYTLPTGVYQVTLGDFMSKNVWS